MFKMRIPVIYFLQLVLRVFFVFFSDAIDEWLGFSQVFSWEGFDPCPGYRGYFLTSMTFELYLSYVNISKKKKSCKWGLIGPNSPRSLKIIFTLLAEVIAVHVQFTKIYIWHLSFKMLFVLLWRLARSLVGLQVSLHELFEQFIGRGRSGSRSSRDSWRISGNIAAFSEGSWWTSYELIFTA